MSGIQNIFGINPKASQIKNSDRVRNEETQKDSPSKKVTKSKKDVRDQAQISSEGRGLLHLEKEAKEYVSAVKEAQTLSDAEIEQLRAKIGKNYTKDPTIIDAIVEKLLQLPNFFER